MDPPPPGGRGPGGGRGVAGVAIEAGHEEQAKDDVIDQADDVKLVLLGGRHVASGCLTDDVELRCEAGAVRVLPKPISATRWPSPGRHARRWRWYR